MKINIRKETPNKFKGRNGWVPDIIVCHITEGSFDGAVSWLCNPNSKAGADFVVARDGRIAQLSDLTDAPYCQGVTVANCAKSTLEVVRNRKVNPNYYCISIEHEGFSNTTSGALTQAQLEATKWLIHEYIPAEVKRIWGRTMTIDREHVVGHYQIDPVNKPNCPGKLFPWSGVLNNKKNMEEDEMTEEQKEALDYVTPKYTYVDDNIPYGLKDELQEAVDLSIVSQVNGGFSPMLSAMDVRQIVFAKRAARK